MLPTPRHHSLAKPTNKPTGLASTPSQLAKEYGFERHQRAYACPVTFTDAIDAKAKL